MKYYSPKSKSGSYRSKPRRKSTRNTALKRKLRWGIFIVILVLIFISFFTGNKSLFKLYTLYQTRNRLVEEKENLQKETRELKSEIKRLETDLPYIEKKAREKYNFKKKNEKVYIIDPE